MGPRSPKRLPRDAPATSQTPPDPPGPPRTSPRLPKTSQDRPNIPRRLPMAPPTRPKTLAKWSEDLPGPPQGMEKRMENHWKTIVFKRFGKFPNMLWRSPK